MKAIKEQDSMTELVAEFVKNRPDQQKIKKLMQQMHLPASDDPIEQMSQCLRYLNETQHKVAPNLSATAAQKKERMKDL